MLAHFHSCDAACEPLLVYTHFHMQPFIWREEDSKDVCRFRCWRAPSAWSLEKTATLICEWTYNCDNSFKQYMNHKNTMFIQFNSYLETLICKEMIWHSQILFLLYSRQFDACCSGLYWTRTICYYLSQKILSEEHYLRFFSQHDIHLRSRTTQQLRWCSSHIMGLPIPQWLLSNQGVLKFCFT